MRKSQLLIAGFALLLGTQLMASATENQFLRSAKVIGDTLVVKVVLDACNHFDGRLAVEPICHKDRLTKNYAQSCEANLSIIGTEMYCPEQKVRTLNISLGDSDIAPEAQELTLNYLGENLTVKLPNRR